MFKHAILCFFVISIFPACSSRTPVNHSLILIPRVDTAESLLGTNIFKPVVPEVVVTSAPPVVVKAAPSFPLTATWIPLDSWAAFHRFTKPVRTGSPTASFYETSREDHRLRISVKDNLAEWNGLEVWLGFPPRIVEGALALHRLDIEKNLEPLVQETVPIMKPQPVVVIDAGHGGPQVGTHSVLARRFEKEFALDWALRLDQLLRSNGWTVVLTRTNDVDLSISNRVAIAEQVKADLFISLHFNSSYPQTDQAGIETYCITPVGMPSSLTRGFGDNATHPLPNNSFDKPNVQYAWRVHQGIIFATRAKDRGLRRARFMSVLSSQNRPAVLIEGGYLSNPREASLITTAEYRQRLAAGVANALPLAIHPTNTVPLQAKYE